MDRMPGAIRAPLKIGLLLAVPALVAWLTGRPFIFPSLGPSAFSLVIDGDGEESARRVVGGHLLGVLGGLVAYHLVAQGVSLAHLPAQFSLPMLRLGASGVISVVLTSLGMLAARAVHPPACATTLIVSLGVLSTVGDALYIMLAVSLMYALHRLLSPGHGSGRR